jgi:hypothetical protein
MEATPATLKVYRRDVPGIPRQDVVFVGRPGSFGNPFTLKVEANRDLVCDQFAFYALLRYLHDPSWLIPLRGMNLICYCAPKRCHADVLLRLANHDLAFLRDGEALSRVTPPVTVAEPYAAIVLDVLWRSAHTFADPRGYTINPLIAWANDTRNAEWAKRGLRSFALRTKVSVEALYLQRWPYVYPQDTHNGG